MKVFWTKEALNCLVSIKNYIASDNPPVAINFVNKLIACAETLSVYPEKGRMVPEFSIKVIREIIFHNYRIVYILKNKRIEILTVFEGYKLLNKKTFSDINVS